MKRLTAGHRLDRTLRQSNDQQHGQKCHCSRQDHCRLPTDQLHQFHHRHGAGGRSEITEKEDTPEGKSELSGEQIRQQFRHAEKDRARTEAGDHTQNDHQRIVTAQGKEDRAEHKHTAADQQDPHPAVPVGETPDQQLTQGIRIKKGGAQPCNMTGVQPQFLKVRIDRAGDQHFCHTGQKKDHHPAEQDQHFLFPHRFRR